MAPWLLSEQYQPSPTPRRRPQTPAEANIIMLMFHTVLEQFRKQFRNEAIEWVSGWSVYCHICIRYPLQLVYVSVKYGFPIGIDDQKGKEIIKHCDCLWHCYKWMLGRWARIQRESQSRKSTMFRIWPIIPLTKITSPRSPNRIKQVPQIFTAFSVKDCQNVESMAGRRREPTIDSLSMIT